MLYGWKSSPNATSMARETAKAGLDTGTIMICATLLAFALTIWANGANAAGHEADRMPVKTHMAASYHQAPMPHVTPYGKTADKGYGLAMQLAPFAVGSKILRHTSTAGSAAAAPVNSRPYIWVKVDSKPAGRSVFLGFVIALFTISALGVMLMWRQVGKSAEPDRPGWESWRSQ